MRLCAQLGVAAASLGVDFREEGGAGLAGNGVGLFETGDGGTQIGIVLQCLFDQFVERRVVEE